MSWAYGARSIRTRYGVGACPSGFSFVRVFGCHLQFSAGVEAGIYCAGAFDIGGLGTRGVLVTYTVAHP